MASEEEIEEAMERIEEFENRGRGVPLDAVILLEKEIEKYIERTQSLDGHGDGNRYFESRKELLILAQKVLLDMEEPVNNFWEEITTKVTKVIREEDYWYIKVGGKWMRVERVE